MKPPTEERFRTRRSLATVLFGDVSGFTRMSEDLDVEVVCDIMNALWDLLDAVVLEHGGFVDKHIGDAIMALWGVDGVSTEDAPSAVDAALCMHERLEAFARERALPLRMRVGVNTGLVFMGTVGSRKEFTAMGDTVNVASRLEHAAPIGGVLVSESTWRLVKDRFEGEVQAPLQVKGKTDPLRTCRVLRSRGGEAPPEGRDHPFVGREQELEIIRRALDETRSGACRMTILEGEPGTGISRLLHEVRQRAGDRVIWQVRTPPPSGFGLARHLLRAILGLDRTAPSDEVAKRALRLKPDDRPLGATLVDLLRVGELPKGAGESRVSAFAACFRALAISADRPILLLLDDLQASDSSSLEVLARLPSMCAGLPMLILAAGLQGWSARLGADRETSRMEIGPLDRDAARALVRSLLPAPLHADLEERILAAAGGNPLYIEEFARMLADRGTSGSPDEEPLPTTLQAVLQARLDALPPDVRTGVQATSVFRVPFAEEALEGEARPGWTDVAEARGILARDESGRWLFRSEIMRRVAWETVLLRDRPRLHRRAADWLGSAPSPEDQAMTIAVHLEEAGEPKESARWWVVAARASARLSAARDALAAYERAMANGLDEPGIRVGMAEVLEQLGDFERLQALLQPVLALADSHVAHAHVVLARAATTRGDLDTAEFHARRALTLGAPPLIANEACRALGTILFFRGAYDEAERLLGETLDKVREHSGALEARCSVDLGNIANARGNPVEAARLYRVAMALHQGTGSQEGVATCLMNLGAVLFVSGDLVAARQSLEEAVAVCQRIDDRTGRLYALDNLGQVLLASGETETASRILLTTFQQSVAMGLDMVALDALTHLARQLMDAGQPEEAATWIGCIEAHAACTSEVRRSVDEVKTAIARALPEPVLEAALRDGRGLDLAAIAEGPLRVKAPECLP